ncbi:MAG: hypothetical protein JWR10_171 [Rubritepida sp.]|nr:hypothetical protein [Rubritepida sp.]
MSRTPRPIFTMACILLLAGCQSQGPAQRTGQALDRAGSRTGEALGRAADDTGAAMNRTGNWIRDRTQ